MATSEHADRGFGHSRCIQEEACRCTAAAECLATDVEYSTWLSPQDIKDKYASVDFLSGNRAIFNIKGNAYRLVVAVRYRNGLVVIDWVGTHAEYSKQNFRD